MSRFTLAAGVAGASLLAGVAATPAFSQEFQPYGPSAYLGAGGGLNILSDMDFTGGRTVDSDAGFAALGTLGYRFGNGFRAELEGGYRSNDADFKQPAATRGKVKAETIMANALIDLDLGWNSIVPYLGGGVGMARTKYEFLGSPDDTNFAFQGIAGLSFRLGEALDAFVDYRYLSTSGLNVTVAGFANDSEYRSQSVMAGLRWTFWGVQRPAAAPVAAAPAPVMATPKDYVIYFEFDRANITDAAGAVLDEIKTNTQTGQTYSVVGHADKSGSDAYNQALSERRASNTATGLTSRGVTVANQAGRGESEPAVPTPDGVKEPLNRRSVIRVNQ